MTAVLLGSSGVGKSTLVNRFAGRELMAVKETRVDDDEGRHTTTHRELILLPGGGIVIDTPGLRELQLWDGGGGVDEAFADVEELALAVPVQRLLAHAPSPAARSRRRSSRASSPRDRHQSWLKLQRELRAIAIRHDARLRREEKRKWQLRAREARARTRHCCVTGTVPVTRTSRSRASSGANPSRRFRWPWRGRLEARSQPARTT